MQSMYYQLDGDGTVVKDMKEFLNVRMLRYREDNDTTNGSSTNAIIIGCDRKHVMMMTLQWND